MNKNRLVHVFEENAVLYEKFRPGYPREVVEELIARSRVGKGDKVLEIGCGTGQLTMELVKQGCNVIAIEKGKSLAAIASSKMSSFDNGEVLHMQFEDWVPEISFQLVVSAQAFHWIDKKAGVDKTLKALKDGGSIALIWNVDQSKNTDFWKQTSKVYDRFFPANEGEGGMEKVVDQHWNYLLSRDELSNPLMQQYDWDQVYSAEAYIGLLHTFSSHQSLPSNKRERFFQEIESIISDFDNQIQRYYKTFLLFATKESQ